MSADVGTHRFAGSVVAAPGLGGQVVEPDARDVHPVEGEDRGDPPDVLWSEPERQFVGLTEKALGRRRRAVRVVRCHLGKDWRGNAGRTKAILNMSTEWLWGGQRRGLG